MKNGTTVIIDWTAERSDQSDQQYPEEAILAYTKRMVIPVTDVALSGNDRLRAPTRKDYYPPIGPWPVINRGRVHVYNGAVSIAWGKDKDDDRVLAAADVGVLLSSRDEQPQGIFVPEGALISIIAIDSPLDQEFGGTQTATIAAGSSLSDAVHLLQPLSALQFPSGWTTAGCTLMASADGVTYNDLYNAAGNELTIAAAASRVVRLDPQLLDGIKYLKVRSGTAGAPVVQAAERKITLIQC